MARGWESKSVESQIESAEERKAAAAKAPSVEELQRQRVRESIELSRTRVLRDLSEAVNPRYRKQLEAALEHLDEKLAAIHRHQH